MVEFMLIGLPRSGTTWAANFFTTDKLHCKHDPLYTCHYSEWDQSELPAKSIGVACTGIWRFPDFLKDHPARKVILHRSLPAVNASLAAIGLPGCTPADVRALNALEGLHVDFMDLFDTEGCRSIWSHLTHDRLPFDEVRHDELVQIEMQPKFSGLKVGKEVTRRLVEELQGALA